MVNTVVIFTSEKVFARYVWYWFRIIWYPVGYFLSLKKIFLGGTFAEEILKIKTPFTKLGIISKSDLFDFFIKLILFAIEEFLPWHLHFLKYRILRKAKTYAFKKIRSFWYCIWRLLLKVFLKKVLHFVLNTEFHLFQERLFNSFRLWTENQKFQGKSEIEAAYMVQSMILFGKTFTF